jgi:hypothetical protein
VREAAAGLAAMSPQASESAIRATAAVLVLVDGPEVELGPLLSIVTDPHNVATLERGLCNRSRAERARAIASILTLIAIDLDDWALR